MPVDDDALLGYREPREAPAPHKPATLDDLLLELRLIRQEAELTNRALLLKLDKAHERLAALVRQITFGVTRAA